MSKADRRRRKLHTHRQAAAGDRSLALGQDAHGSPECAPTPERARRGDLSTQTLISGAPPSFTERDWTGDRKASFPRSPVIGVVRRDLDASAAHRLARFHELTSRQLAAAGRLERDWELAQVEPRMVVDLRATSTGGVRGGADLRAAVLDARDRLQEARRTLRRGGDAVVNAVEAAVTRGAGSLAAGDIRYVNRRDSAVRARALLGVGLNLLADWYGESRA